jgi:hypothetical protein
MLNQQTSEILLKRSTKDLNNNPHKEDGKANCHAKNDLGA